jgi:hypothetical protein
MTVNCPRGTLEQAGVKDGETLTLIDTAGGV